MRSLTRLTLAPVVAPSAPDLWAVRSLAHLVALRAVAVAFRGLLARWEEVVRVSGTSEPLILAGDALDALGRVESVSLSDAPVVDPGEARALFDVADHGKTLMGQLGALYRAPRWDRDRWVDRLAGTVERLAGALDRVPEVRP